VKKLIPVICVIILAFAAAGSAGAQNFKGFYFGGYAGGSVDGATAQTTTVFSSTGYFDPTSVTAINSTGLFNFAPHAINGGGQTGYNFRFGHFVLGAELDYGSLRINVTHSATAGYPDFAPSTFTITQSLKTRGLFTARPRAGLAFGHIFFYGTFGVALANVNYQEAFSDNFAAAAENGGVKVDKAGWTGGGGVEIALSRHWSMKGEYLYIHMGTLTNTSTNLVAFSSPPVSGVASPSAIVSESFPQNPFTLTATLHEHVGRFGINFWF